MLQVDAGLDFNLKIAPFESNGGGYSGNPVSDLTNGVFSLANNAIDLTGQTVNGVFDLAGQTVNGAFGIFGNGNSGNSSLSTEQGGSPASGERSGGSSLGNLFRGLGDVTRSMSDSLMKASGPLHNISVMQFQHQMMLNDAFYGWNSPFSWYGYGGAYGMREFRALCGPYMSGYYHTPSIYSYATYPPTTSPNNGFAPLDRVIADATKPANNGRNKKNDGPVTVDANGNPPPSWYTDIINKENDNKELTEAEKKLKESYETMAKKYAVVDKNGQPTTFAKEIMELDAFIKKVGYGGRDAIERKLKSMPPEKLAAIEKWYPTVIQGGGSFRAMIKSNVIFGGGWTAWTGYNTDAALRMFDILDEAAVKSSNPMTVAESLRQAINNHRMFGLGADHDRVVKMIKSAKGQPELIKVIKAEYGLSLEADIEDKWFMDAADKQECLAILASAESAQ